MKAIRLLSLSLCYLSLISCDPLKSAYIEAPDVNKEGVQIQKVDRTPEADNVLLTMAYPLRGQVETENPVSFSLKIEGYPLGTNSPFERTDEIANSDKGQTIHIIVDNEPYFAKGREVIDVFDYSENYYLDDIVVELPLKLSPGQHLLRVFPARSYGESLKGNGTFVARTFFFKNENKKLDVDLSAPLLTYNEPQGEYSYKKGRAILLDFIVSNCELSRDGYKVRVKVDGTITRTLTEWSPYYIYGLKPGKHTVMLELLNPNNAPVAGSYNTLKRDFTIVE